MMKLIGFLVVFCTLNLLIPPGSSGAGGASISPGEAPRHRRFIFLVHGLNGSRTTFGDLHLVLKTHGVLIQPETDLKVIPLEYDTGRNGLTTYDFAIAVGDQIERAVDGLRPTDRLTFVTHSQGGLVSWIWILKSLAGDSGFEKFTPYASQTEGLMTLGSPTWGSKMAEMASDWAMIRTLAKKVGAPLGDREVKEMSPMSDTSVRFSRRASMMDRANSLLPLRFQAVAGLVRKSDDPSLDDFTQFKLLAFQTFWGQGWNKLAESDLAVAIPSARANFIHLKDSKSSKSVDLRASDFSVVEDPSVRDLIIVRGIHASSDQEKSFDIAETPLSCINLKEACPHPSYGLVLQFTMECTPLVNGCQKDEFSRLTKHFLQSKNFLERTNIKGDPLLEHMHLFTVNIVMDMPRDYRPPSKSEEIENYISFFKNSDFLSVTGLSYRDATRGLRNIPEMVARRQKNGYYFILNRALEFDGVVTHIATDYTDNLSPMASPLQLRISINGQVYSNDGKQDTYRNLIKNGFKLPMTVRIPGFPERNVEALVRPTYSTFINLDFRP